MHIPSGSDYAAERCTAKSGEKTDMRFVVSRRAPVRGRRHADITIIFGESAENRKIMRTFAGNKSSSPYVIYQ